MGASSLVPCVRTWSPLPAVVPILVLLTGACRPADSHPPDPTTILTHDNQVPAGVLRDGLLAVRLEVRSGFWYPEGPEGPGIPVHAFAEEGAPMQVPGPLLRMPQGTEVEVTVTNRLDGDTLSLHGLGPERGLAEEPDARLAPGEGTTLRFRAGDAGTYYYGAVTVGDSFLERFEEDSQLSGAIVVDPAGVPVRPEDRIFLISWWFTEDSTLIGPSGFEAGTMTINGRSWPHTERFRATVGDTLRWRWINVTEAPHPMHLHGFYFRVDAHGDGIRDTIFQPDERRLAVTEALWPGHTLVTTWSPERPGNWVFHCHFAFHISHELRLSDWWDKGTRSVASGGHGDHGIGGNGHGSHEMAGLVLGIEVSPRRRGSWETPPSPDARPIGLEIRSAPERWGKAWGYAYVLESEAHAVPKDVLPIPGPLLVLERGRPVAVTLRNRSHEPAAVHWHGIELDSYPDGVPGWSGRPGRILPSIAPGESLTVEFTPPRSGTFMYHSHFNEMAQLEAGLYGPIVVVDRRGDHEPERDHIVLFSIGGPGFDTAPLLLNGVEEGPLPHLVPGVPNRLRIINITAEHGVLLQIRTGEEPAEWTVVAKDGADLPGPAVRTGPAVVTLLPGEIVDVLFTPDPEKAQEADYILLPQERITTVPLAR